MGTSSDAAQSKSHGFRRVGGKKTPGDTAVNDAFPSAFASVSAHLLEGATDSVLTGSTNAGHSGDDEAAERSAQRESESLDLWNSFEPITVTDQRRKAFNVRSEMITRCKLNIQKYRETIAALEEQAGK